MSSISIDSAAVMEWEVGDVVTVEGIYADGTRWTPADGPAANPDKALKHWRVIEITDDDVRLRPLMDDGSIDELADLPDGYRIVRLS